MTFLFRFGFWVGLLLVFAGSLLAGLSLLLFLSRGQLIDGRIIGLALLCSLAWLCVSMLAARHARDARAEHEALLARMAEASCALDSVSDGVIVYDHNWRFLYLNQSAVEVADRPREDLLGRVLWDVYPELVGSELHGCYLRAYQEQSARTLQYFSVPTKQWLEIRVFPSAGRISVVLRDISAEHAAMVGLEVAREDLARQLSESQRVANSLRQSNRQLDERNRQLQEFTHIASHDLQEPLRKIRVFGELLGEHSGELSAPAQDFLQRMLGAAARMQTLINSLLAFARVGINRPAEVSVDVGRITAEAIAEVFAASEVLPDVKIGTLPFVVGDPVLFRQVMQNLISNSVKFVKDGERPRIEVAGERFRPEGVSEEWCRITVRDHGIGFEAEESERIFDLFSRLHGRGSYKGSGIGLAIVRRIMEHHGGRVRASGTPGAGACFELELPILPPSQRGTS